MKKTTTNNRNIKSKSDEKFAKKFLSQTLVSLLVFALVFINSKLPYTLSKKISQTIRYYLTMSVDFNKAVDTVKIYFDDFYNQVQTLPASGDTNNNSADES